MILCKIEQDNCVNIQQIFNEMKREKLYFAVLCKILDESWQPMYITSQICYLQMMDKTDFPTIYGHRVNLLMNNMWVMWFCSLFSLFSLTDNMPAFVLWLSIRLKQERKGKC